MTDSSWDNELPEWSADIQATRDSRRFPLGKPAVLPENDTQAAIGSYMVAEGEYTLPKDFNVKSFFQTFKQDRVFTADQMDGSKTIELYENAVRYHPILSINESEAGTRVQVHRPAALAQQAQNQPEAVTALMQGLTQGGLQAGMRERGSPEVMANLSKDVAASIAQLRNGLDPNKQTTGAPTAKAPENQKSR